MTAYNRLILQPARSVSGGQTGQRIAITYRNPMQDAEQTVTLTSVQDVDGRSTISRSTVLSLPERGCVETRRGRLHSAAALQLC